MKADVLDALLAARQGRHAVAVITELSSGEQQIVASPDVHKHPLGATLSNAFRFDQSGVQRLAGQEFFVHIHNPPLRLVIVGAVHIAQAVIPVAQLAGYDIIVIDPRGAFATGARFPGMDLHVEWPDEVIPKTGLDARTAMIALTHDPKIDDPALSAALASDVFYIGALGSKKTHTTRCERLRAKGFDDAQIARIRGPIGLAIGAKGAPEIAIAIMAEMTRALRLGS
jgi:xanthine dehydrogenase accessory factor